MSHNILALDLGSGQISAVLSVYDEATGTCRVRRAARAACPALSACYVLDLAGAVGALQGLLAEMSEYASFSPTVVVGLRGEFLSYRRSSGFKNIESKNRLITERDVREALDNSVPPTLDESLEVVDLLPQGFTIDGKSGVQNPVGLEGFCLEAETFLSCGLVTHLNNLNRALEQSGCEDFEAVPAVLALGGTLLRPEEKQAGVLLLDVGAAHCSAALYHKGLLEGAWEMSFGAEMIVHEVAEVLQNDLKSARAVLKDYTYGDDEIMDEVLDEAAAKLLREVKKELMQSLCYVKHAPVHAVLTGGGAQENVKNAAKSVLGVRRARCAAHDDLIADSEDLLLPAYTTALSLVLHSQRHGAGSTAREPAHKNGGLLGRMLAKLGLS